MFAILRGNILFVILLAGARVISLTRIAVYLINLYRFSTACQPYRNHPASIIVCRGESHMGAVLGGTHSGSAQWSLYWGNGKGMDFLSLAIQEPESRFSRDCFPVLFMPVCGRFSTLQHHGAIRSSNQHLPHAPPEAGRVALAACSRSGHAQLTGCTGG